MATTPRKNKLNNPRVRKAILDGLRAGLTQKAAAAKAGVHETTLSQWLAKGRESAPGTIAHQFQQEVQLAIDEAEANLIQKIASADDWKASSWLLSRRHHHWRSKNSPEVTDALERLAVEKAELEVAKLRAQVELLGGASDDEVEELLTAIRNRKKDSS